MAVTTDAWSRTQGSTNAMNFVACSYGFSLLLDMCAAGGKKVKSILPLVDSSLSRFLQEEVVVCCWLCPVQLPCGCPTFAGRCLLPQGNEAHDQQARAGEQGAWLLDRDSASGVSSASLYAWAPLP